MVDSIGNKPQGIETEVMEQPRSEVRHMPMDHIPLDLDDPHRAALEDNPEKAETLTWTTLLAVAVSSIRPPVSSWPVFQLLTNNKSLSFSYVCPISCGFVLVTGILVPIGTDLGDTENISWIVGGWSIASSVSFSMAGALSDIFGRRWTIVSGEVLAIIGSVCICLWFGRDLY